jgi:hypothetical protein
MAVTLGLATGASHAAVVSVEVGTPHFADGAIVGSGTFIGAVSGQPAPFNTFAGGDVAGPDFIAIWTLEFTPPATIQSAWVELGIYDHDTQASGNQVAEFAVSSIALTAEASAVMEARGGASGEYNIYTIPLPSTVFPSLATGSATFSLILRAPGLGVLGETAGNGAGLDFVRLSVSDVIPEPSAGLLLCAAGIGGLVRRRRSHDT